MLVLYGNLMECRIRVNSDRTVGNTRPLVLRFVAVSTGILFWFVCVSVVTCYDCTLILKSSDSTLFTHV